jgi:hypothetical protein
MCFASHLVRRNELQSPGFLAAPAKFASETKRRNSLSSAPTRLSLVPREMPIKPNMPDFRRTLRGISEREDCVAERGGFEPPEPRAILRAEFGPVFVDYLAQKKASKLERFCSPWIRLFFRDHVDKSGLYF